MAATMRIAAVALLLVALSPVAAAHPLVPCLGVPGNLCVFHERGGSDCRAEDASGYADDRVLLDVAEARASSACSSGRWQRSVFVWAAPPVVSFVGVQAGRVDEDGRTQNYVSAGTWAVGRQEVTVFWDGETCHVRQREFDGLTGEWRESTRPCPADVQPPPVFPDVDAGYLLP